MESLDTQIKDILERNKRVEKEKAWETSWTRKFFLMILTYITACAFLTVTMGDHTRALLPAFVPPLAYLVSTFTLGPLKKWWMENVYKN